jgi:hypothetical protein
VRKKSIDGFVRRVDNIVSVVKVANKTLDSLGVILGKVDDAFGGFL